MLLYWRGWRRKAREDMGALWENHRKPKLLTMLSIVTTCCNFGALQAFPIPGLQTLLGMPRPWLLWTMRHYCEICCFQEPFYNLCWAGHVNESAPSEAEEHADRADHQNGRIISKSKTLTIWLPISDEQLPENKAGGENNSMCNDQRS